MKRTVLLAFGLSTLLTVSGCAPSLSSELVAARLSLDSAPVIAGTSVEIQSDVDILDESISEQFTFELVIETESGDRTVIGPFEGQGDTARLTSFTPQPGKSEAFLVVKSNDGTVLFETEKSTLVAVAKEDYSLTLETRHDVWLTEYALAADASIDGDTAIQGLSAFLELESENSWSKIEELNLKEISDVDLEAKTEGEGNFRLALYLNEELVAASEEIEVYFRGPESMISSLAYDSRIAAEQGAQAQRDFEVSITYPGLYDFTQEDTSELLYYNYTETWIVVKDSVREDPTWVLPSHECQISFLGETPPGKTFVFQREGFGNDRFGNVYQPYKVDVHATFFDGKMWLYNPPLSC